MNKSFIESVYYNEFKKIRNRLRKYDSILLLRQCLEVLNNPDIKMIKKLPWHVLLIVKWLLNDEQFPVSSKRTITKEGLLRIILDVNKIEAKTIRYQKSRDLHLIMRRFAYQQFYYQKGPNFNAIARQLILYDELERNHYFKRKFFEKVGIEINEFIKISTYLMYYCKEGGYSNINFCISNFISKVDRNSLRIFLKNMSLDSQNASNWVKQASKKSRGVSEFYEQTIFIEYPLIELNGQYYIYHEGVLNRSLEYFIYDLLKKDNPNLSMSKFGVIFENYIDKLLSYSGVKYKREKELIDLIGRKSKVIDFIIQQGASSILIDAKGVEMHYRGKVSLDPNIIKGKVKSSAIKAIEQAYESIHKLKKISNYRALNDFNNNYLIVVTYKELYLGNGVEFERRIGKDFFHKIRKDYGKELYIPLQNIYFISVDSLEFWVEMVNKKKITFLEVLKKAIELDSNNSTQKFHFMGHLSDLGIEMKSPDFINEKFKTILQ